VSARYNVQCLTYWIARHLFAQILSLLLVFSNKTTRIIGSLNAVDNVVSVIVFDTGGV